MASLWAAQAATHRRPCFGTGDDAIEVVVAVQHYKTDGFWPVQRHRRTFGGGGNCTVYYIQCGAFIKIGTSINPETRCDQLVRGGKAKQPSLWVGNPQLIAYLLPGNVAKEKELHREFAGTRDEGEWFFMNEELVDYVADAQIQQALTQSDLHHKHYEQMVEDGEWPAAHLDIAQTFRQHLATKNRLDPEWAEAFDA
jgi:hypothetical protein